MEILAAALLTGLVVGYFVLAGCDIGLGMLMPYLARTEGDRRRVVAALAPYFLGTEVWLVGAVGVTLGLFPALEGEVVAAAWPALVALLVGWLTRDAGLWFRARVDSAGWRGTWDACVTAGSWTVALGWGLVIGSLLGGGRPFSPFAVACALVVAVLFALRGAAFGAERLVPAGHVDVSDTAESADVAAVVTRVLARAALAGAALAAAVAVLAGGATVERPLPALAVLAVLAAALVPTAGVSGPRLSRHTSAVAMGTTPLLVAAALELPTTAAPDGTLALVGFAMAPVTPLMLVGQVWLYRMLRRPAAVSGFFA